jgi:hypothetical protein
MTARKGRWGDNEWMSEVCAGWRVCVSACAIDNQGTCVGMKDWLWCNGGVVLRATRVHMITLSLAQTPSIDGYARRLDACLPCARSRVATGCCCEHFVAHATRVPRCELERSALHAHATRSSVNEARTHAMACKSTSIVDTSMSTDRVEKWIAINLH